MKTIIHVLSYLSHFFLEWDECCRENQNTRFVFRNFFFRKSCCLWVNVEKCCRAAQGTDDNMAHAIACRLTKATNAHTVV